MNEDLIKKILDIGQKITELRHDIFMLNKSFNENKELEKAFGQSGALLITIIKLLNDIDKEDKDDE